MKLAIIGSRLFDNYEIFKNYVDEYIKEIGQINEIVSGGAFGADKMAERYANENNIIMKIFRPDYKNEDKIKIYGQRWGKIAPLERNKLIIDYCDYVIAFPFSESNGTLNALEHAQKMNKQSRIIYVDEFIKKP